MPYIPEENREKFDSLVDELAKTLSQNSCLLAGELNYIISRLCWQLCGYKPKNWTSNEAGERRYNRMNSIIGVLEASKLELYRRLVSDYEDEKIEQTGDL